MDWRVVASRMDVKPSTIEKTGKYFKEDLTQKFLEEISDKKIMQLLQVSDQMDRRDVFGIVFEKRVATIQRVNRRGYGKKFRKLTKKRLKS